MYNSFTILPVFVGFSLTTGYFIPQFGFILKIHLAFFVGGGRGGRSSHLFNTKNFY